MICALIAPSGQIYSETFIRDHVQRLPCLVLPLYGDLASLKFQNRCILPRPVRFAVSLSRARSTAHRLIANFLRRRQVDVILAEYATTAAWFAPIAALARIPLVVHCHGYDVYQEEIVSAYPQLFPTATAFIVGSTDMRARVIALGAPPNRVTYNPCGVDLDLFPPTNPANNPPVIVAVGRFVDKKAPWATILAFQEALSQCPEAQLIMAGEGPLLGVCRQLVQALGIVANVTFPGKQDHAAVAALLHGARAFAQHSVRAANGDSEGTAISVLEASATALPVIATAHAGIKDTVVHGQTGYLVQELDIAQMAHYMTKLLLDPNIAATFGQAGRERVQTSFPMAKSIAGIQAVLERTQK